MISSYLVFIVFPQFQPISKHDIANLFDLIRLGFGAGGLQVQYFLDKILGKDVVAASNPLIEREFSQ